MWCERCGTPLERPGQGHTCRSAYFVPAGLPLGWQVATWVVVGFCVLLAVCLVAATVVRLLIFDDLVLSGGRSSNRGLLLADVVISLITTATWIGLFVSHLIWSRGTRRIADRFGDDSGWYVRPRNVVALYVTLFFLGVLALCATGNELRAAVVIASSIQLVVVTCVAIAVLAGWWRIRGLAADSATQKYAAAGAPPPVSRFPAEWPPPEPPPTTGPEVGDPTGTGIVEQSRGLAPHRAPLNADATEADWNPHGWDPEVEDELRRRGLKP